METKKLTLTLYKSIEHGWFQTWEGAAPPGYVAVSAPLEVAFPLLPAQESIGAELGALNDLREQVVKKFTTALADIDDKKAKLLALTVQS